jgi:hypothetical protein
MTDNQLTTTAFGMSVDFPTQPTRQSREQKKVTFASFSEMVIIPQDEAAAKAYSEDDIRHFKQALLLDVLRLRHEFASAPAQNISQEQLCRCRGLEHFLSQDALMNITAARRAHVVVVLEEERNQDQRNTLDEDELSRVSMGSSRWARVRAEQLAVGYVHFQG